MPYQPTNAAPSDIRELYHWAHDNLKSIVVDPPASASAPGRVGQVAFDSSYAYRCTAPNTWERAALGFATW